jgi:hypothetical protein
MTHINQFSTDSETIDRNRTVYVESLNSFPDPTGIDNKEIHLVDGVNYEWTKPLTASEMQDFRFIFPTAGSVSLSTSSQVSNSLTTGITTGAALFSGTPDRVIIDGLDIFASDGGTWIDLTGAATAFPNLFLTGSRVQGFDSLGTMTGMGYLAENVSYFFNKAGLTSHNALLMALDEQNFAGQQGDHFIFTGSLSFATMRAVLSAPLTGDALFNFDPALITGGIQIHIGAFNPTGGGSMFAAGGLNETSPSVRVTNVLNAASSNILIGTRFTGGTTPTILSDTSTFVQIAGTYIDGLAERSASSGGVITYAGFDPITMNISAGVQLLLTPETETDIIEISLFKNGVEITESRAQHELSAVFQTPTSPYFNVSANVKITFGNTLDVRMRNVSNPTNVIATDVIILGGTNA